MDEFMVLCSKHEQSSEKHKKSRNINRDNSVVTISQDVRNDITRAKVLTMRNALDIQLPHPLTNWVETFGVTGAETIPFAILTSKECAFCRRKSGGLKHIMIFKNKIWQHSPWVKSCWWHHPLNPDIQWDPTTVHQGRKQIMLSCIKSALHFHASLLQKWLATLRLTGKGIGF